MEQIQIHVSKQQLEYLRKRAGALGVTISEVVRRILDAQLPDPAHADKEASDEG